MLIPGRSLQLDSTPSRCTTPRSRRGNLLQIASVQHSETLASTQRLVENPASLHQSATLAELSSHQDAFLNRRTVLALASVVAIGLASGANCASAQEAELAPEAATASAWKPYRNEKQQYSLSIPSFWDVKDKAGADVLFEDPNRRSTNVGVVVNPVRRVKTLGEFGSLEDVGEKLLAAERAKESTIGVSLVSSSSRTGPTSGALIYDYEYELDSTRGRKRILSTVCIYQSRLYIFNAAYKCGKAACSDEDIAAVGVLRDVADTFDVGL